MKIACPKCKTTYGFDETRLPDKGIAFKCKACQNQFNIKKEKKHSEDFIEPLSEKLQTNIKATSILIKCPRCKLPQKGTNECEYCRLVFDKPPLEISSNNSQPKVQNKKSQTKVKSKKPFVVALILTLIFGTTFTSYRYFVAPYLVNRAEEKKKQEKIKAEKADLQNCKEAYLAFMKVEASLESGRNFQDYSNFLGNAKYELNILKTSSKIYGVLASTYKFYDLAQKIWSSIIRRDYKEMCALIENYHKATGTQDTFLNSKYYQIAYMLKTEQIMVEQGAKEYPDPRYQTIANFLAKDTQQLIWSHASKGLRLYEERERSLESQQ